MTDEMINQADRRIAAIGRRAAANEAALKKAIAESSGVVDLTCEDPPTTAPPRECGRKE